MTPVAHRRGRSAAGLSLMSMVLFGCHGWTAVIAQTASPAAQPGQEPGRYGFGRPAAAADIARWDIDVRPDGTGLPPGSGTPADGKTTYAARCAACHGPTGREGPNDVLVGPDPRDARVFGSDPRVIRTIGNYWPFATTLFDYIRRAMPPTAPRSLRDSEVYGLVAYVLSLNGIVAADATMDATSLAKVVMPARDRFVVDPRGGPVQPPPASRP